MLRMCEARGCIVIFSRGTGEGQESLEWEESKFF